MRGKENGLTWMQISLRASYSALRGASPRPIFASRTTETRLMELSPSSSGVMMTEGRGWFGGARFFRPKEDPRGRAGGSSTIAAVFATRARSERSCVSRISCCKAGARREGKTNRGDDTQHKTFLRRVRKTHHAFDSALLVKSSKSKKLFLKERGGGTNRHAHLHHVRRLSK